MGRQLDAFLTQTLADSSITMLELAAPAVRTWWSGSVAHTLTPEYSLKVLRRGQTEAETVAIPKSGEVFELEENLRRAFAAFRENRSPLPPEEAKQSVAVCLAAEEAHASGRPVAPDF
jgi:myo-inositol 2-dehydrogenase/D-chiro-inositol 1-dehydrogenase